MTQEKALGGSTEHLIVVDDQHLGRWSNRLHFDNYDDAKSGGDGRLAIDPNGSSLFSAPSENASVCPVHALRVPRTGRGQSLGLPGDGDAANRP
jgi:hypothetical protein